MKGCCRLLLTVVLLFVAFWFLGLFWVAGWLSLIRQVDYGFLHELPLLRFFVYTPLSSAVLCVLGAVSVFGLEMSFSHGQKRVKKG